MFIEKETFTRFLESIIMNQEPPKENKKRNQSIKNMAIKLAKLYF